MCTSFVVLWSILAGSGHAAIDPESIVAIWTFDEGKDEDVKDVSGNGNDGVVLGKPRWVNGKFGMALSLDGQGNVVQIAQFGNVAPTKEVTITIWVLVNGVKNQDLLSFDPIIGVNRITIHLPWNDDIVWQHGTDQHGAGAAMPEDTLGNWEFWAFLGSTKGNYMRVLRNMEEFDLREDAPENKPAFRTSEQNWNIAGRRGSSYTGVIDELGVFKEVLIDDDIRSIMDKGLEQTALAEAVSPLGRLTTTWSRIKARD
jgi:hypothetical protein